VTFPAFKAGDSVLRGSNGGFDFHTPPPQIVNVYAGILGTKSSCSVGVADLVDYIPMPHAAPKPVVRDLLRASKRFLSWKPALSIRDLEES
jgi:hypothetical protein